MPKVTFLNEQITVEAEPGQTVLQVADKHGINLFRGLFQELHCNRISGWCNRCKVWATGLGPEAINPRTAKENIRLRLNGALPKHGNMRLACQVVVSGDCEVRTRSGFTQSQSLEWAPDPRHFKWRDRWDHRNDEPAEDEKPKKAPAPKPAVAKPAAAAPAAPAPAAAVEVAPAIVEAAAIAVAPTAVDTGGPKVEG